jgi:hypothetical protein
VVDVLGQVWSWPSASVGSGVLVEISVGRDVVGVLDDGALVGIG